MMDGFKNFDESILEAEAPEEREGFVVDSLEKAEWAAGMYALRMQRIEELKAYAKAKIDKVNEWLDKETESLTNDAMYFQGLLQPYAQEEVKRLKKGKSFKLSNGCKLSFRASKEKATPDKEELLKWLEANGQTDFIEVEKKAKWGDFKKTCIIKDGKMITADGEVLEFVEIEPAGEDTFSVDIKGMQ